MRMLIALFIAILIVCSPAMAQVPDFTKVYTSGSLVDGSTTLPKLGAIVFIQDQNKAYKFVRNVGAVTAAGDIVCYSVTNGVTQNALYEVTTPGTNANVMAGVCMGAIPATTGQGWIQILGHNATIAVNGNPDIVLGDSLKISATFNFGVKDQVIGTEPTYHRHIIALEAYTTDSETTKEGYILCWP